MRSVTTLDLQYTRRFYGFKGEAQHLHGHTGILMLEVENTVNAGINMVLPYNKIQKVAWEVLKNFDRTTILWKDDPLLPVLLGVYEAQGIKDGALSNIMRGSAFKIDLTATYLGCRPVVTKETMAVEGMIKVVYNLLKDELSTVKITFTSGINAAFKGPKPQRTMERCPLCGIALDESGVYPKCDYRKQNWHRKQEAGIT